MLSVEASLCSLTNAQGSCRDSSEACLHRISYTSKLPELIAWVHDVKHNNYRMAGPHPAIYPGLCFKFFVQGGPSYALCVFSSAMPYSWHIHLQMGEPAIALTDVIHAYAGQVQMA